MVCRDLAGTAQVHHIQQVLSIQDMSTESHEGHQLHVGLWATTFGRVIPTVAMGHRFNSEWYQAGFSGLRARWLVTASERLCGEWPGSHVQPGYLVQLDHQPLRRFSLVGGG